MRKIQENTQKDTLYYDCYYFSVYFVGHLSYQIFFLIKKTNSDYFFRINS